MFWFLFDHFFLQFILYFIIIFYRGINLQNEAFVCCEILSTEIEMNNFIFLVLSILVAVSMCAVNKIFVQKFIWCNATRKYIILIRFSSLLQRESLKTRLKVRDIVKKIRSSGFWHILVAMKLVKPSLKNIRLYEKKTKWRLKMIFLKQYVKKKLNYWTILINFFRLYGYSSW